MQEKKTFIKKTIKNTEVHFCHLTALTPTFQFYFKRSPRKKYSKYKYTYMFSHLYTSEYFGLIAIFFLVGITALSFKSQIKEPINILLELLVSSVFILCGVCYSICGRNEL